MEYYFDTDDKLDRRKYAEFLKSMLENCDKYRREDSDGAYVIAIDSPWGTGKTRFAKMLRNFLEGREPNVVAGKADQSFIPPAKEDRKFNVIYYNSWETDYWGDALEPLIHNVLNSELFELVRADKDCDDVTNKLLRATKGVLKAVGLGFARNIIGEAAAEVIKGTIDEISKDDPDPLAAYSESIKMYNQFKEALAQTIEQTGRKLVIIVDELDRCRPTFAIQTLELAKHLFSVEGLIFIFALDIKQLSSSVKTVYGQDLDAPGYLCRFFDYLSKMPQPSIWQFIDDLLGDLNTKKNFYPDNGFRSMLIANISGLATIHSLSLRDVSTLITTYRILFRVCLANYPDISSHQLYLYLLFLKYKDSFSYEQLLFGKLPIDTIEKDFSETITMQYGENLTKQSRRLKLLGTNISIENVTYRTYNCITGSTMEGRLFARFFTLRNINNPDMKYYIKTEHAQQAGGYDFQDTENLEQVLYYEDLKKWDRIKSLTLGQYYYQQLEMFNFALPADEPETKA